MEPNVTAISVHRVCRITTRCDDIGIGKVRTIVAVDVNGNRTEVELFGDSFADLRIEHEEDGPPESEFVFPAAAELTEDNVVTLAGRV